MNGTKSLKPKTRLIVSHERFVFKLTSVGVRVFIRKEQQQTKRKEGGGSTSKCSEVRTDENQFRGLRASYKSFKDLAACSEIYRTARLNRADRSQYRYEFAQDLKDINLISVSARCVRSCL